MTSRLVVIGGSAGAVEGLHQILLSLPPAFPAPICAVIHLSPRTPSVLAAVLGRHARITVRSAVDGDPLDAGIALIAPPDQHLVVSQTSVTLSHEPANARQRPSVDVLFRSAAAAFGRGCIGVILSGALDDGADGLAAIKAAGGLAVVQSPADALMPDMPRNALARVAADHVRTLAELPAVLTELVARA